MAEARGSVSGAHSEHKTVFYGLSTCIWCRRSRQLLEDAGVSFDFTYVDLLKGKEREHVVDEVRRWNPSVSFPTIVVDDSECVVGHSPEKLKGALGL